MKEAFRVLLNTTHRIHVVGPAAGEDVHRRNGKTCSADNDFAFDWSHSEFLKVQHMCFHFSITAPLKSTIFIDLVVGTRNER